MTLRASLRVAVALEALPGGVASLWYQIARQKITPLHTVIRTAATDWHQAEALLTHAAVIPLVQIAPLAQATLLALLVPAEGEATPSNTSAPIPLPRLFTELLSRVINWLHWPPLEVWNASVSEIVTALEAQDDREILRAGVKPEDRTAKAEQRQANVEAGLDPDFDRASLQRLKEKM